MQGESSALTLRSAVLQNCKRKAGNGLGGHFLSRLTVLLVVYSPIRCFRSSAVRKGLQQLKDEVKDLELESRQVGLYLSQTAAPRFADNTPHPPCNRPVVTLRKLLVHKVLFVKQGPGLCFSFAWSEIACRRQLPMLFHDVELHRNGTEKKLLPIQLDNKSWPNVIALS